MSKEQIEAQRQQRISELEAIANNELTAPVFRERADKQLNELGVGKERCQQWSDLFEAFDGEVERD